MSFCLFVFAVSSVFCLIIFLSTMLQHLKLAALPFIPVTSTATTKDRMCTKAILNLGLDPSWASNVFQTMAFILEQGALTSIPRGSRYLIIKELGPKDHDYYGFGGLSP